MEVPLLEVIPTVGPMETVAVDLLSGEIVLHLMDYRTRLVWIVTIVAAQPLAPIRSELRQIEYDIAHARG